jgi:hypothetical protein
MERWKKCAGIAGLALTLTPCILGYAAMNASGVELDSIELDKDGVALVTAEPRCDGIQRVYGVRALWFPWGQYRSVGLAYGEYGLQNPQECKQLPQGARIIRNLLIPTNNLWRRKK